MSLKYKCTARNEGAVWEESGLTWRELVDQMSNVLHDNSGPGSPGHEAKCVVSVEIEGISVDRLRELDKAMMQAAEAAHERIMKHTILEDILNDTPEFAQCEEDEDRTYMYDRFLEHLAECVGPGQNQGE
jgi:hypothetical protein